MANKSGRKSSWLELELTVTTIEPGNCQVKSELLHVSGIACLFTRVLLPVKTG
jgi:hypothetical protein